MRILLTGASGFIGRHCLPLLSKTEHEIHAVSRTRRRDRGRVQWHAADLLQPDAVSVLLADVRPDALLHLAWFVAPAEYKQSPENLRWLEESTHLLETFVQHGGTRAVVAGSSMEYDWSEGICAEDSTQLCPQNVYSRCKNDLRIRVEKLARELGMSWAWARLFFMYGPGEPPTRLVPSVIRSLLRGERARCSPGEQVRDFLHVEDVASGVVGTLLSGVEGAINIGSGEGVSVRALATCIGELIGRGDLLHFGAQPAPVEPSLVVAKIDRLRLEVGWKPRYNLKNGISSTIQWWRQQATNVAGS